MLRKYIFLILILLITAGAESFSQWRAYSVPDYLRAGYFEQFPDFYRYPINGKLKYYEASPDVLKYKPEQTKFLTSDGIEVVNVSSTFPNAKTETWIALNPTNPANIIATCNDNAYLGGLDGFRMSAFVTNDFGATWAHKPTPRNKGQWINPTGNQATIFDPGIAYDSKGSVYYVYGFSETTWGSEDKDTEMNGVFIVKSTDGGQNWNALKEGSESGIVAITTDALKTSGNPFHDRYTLTVDATEGSQFKDNVYVTWRVFRGMEGVVFSRSTDGGETWSPYRRLATGGQAPQPVTGPNGEVYVTWIDVDFNNYSIAKFMKSVDGGANFGANLEAQKVISVGDRHPVSGRNVLTNKQGIRVSSVPQMASDNSNSPYRGNLYVVQAGRENTGGQYGIYLAKSTNKGTTWTKNVRIDSNPLRNDMFFPSIACDPVTGMVAVLYYSSQNDPKNVGVDAYVAISNDGGETWKNLRVSPNTFYLNSQATVFPQGGDGNIYWGDYTHIVAYNSRVYPLYWAPTRLTDYNYGTTALFTAFISPAPQVPTAQQFLTINNPTTLKLTWTHPTKNLLGEVLGNFKINIYKGVNKIGEVAKNQTPEFYDNDVVYGSKYTYYLETETENGLKSSKVEILATVGGNQKPKPVTELTWRPKSNGINLIWRNPSQTIDNEPLLDELKIAIYDAKTNQLIEKIGPSNFTAGANSNYTVVLETEKFYELNIKAIAVRGGVETESDYALNGVIAFSGNAKSDIAETFDIPQSRVPVYIKGKWGLTTTKSSTAPNSFTDSPDANYAVNSNEYFMLPPVVLSSGKSTISFDHIALIDSVVRTDVNGIQRFDYGEIAYSNDFGLTWKMLKWVNVNSSPEFVLNNLDASKWQNLAFNLNQITGDTVLFKFTLGSNDFRNTDGWYIDNINLDGRPTSVDYNLYEMTMVSVNPNPVKNFAVLSMKTAVDAEIRIELFDVLGNKIISENLGQKSAGDYSFEYNLSNLANGMYFYRINIGNFTKTLSVSVTK
jgi:hypothetical protein